MASERLRVDDMSSSYKRKYGQGTFFLYGRPDEATYLDDNIFVGARVLCSDGRVRKCSRISAIADTFYSVPAAVSAYGKTVSGYVTIETLSGSSVETEDDPLVAKFYVYQYGKNADVLPPGLFRSISAWAEGRSCSPAPPRTP